MAVLVDPILRVSGLSHDIRFANHTLPILRDVSFDIARGESVCIVGRSGSGKSTLLELISLLTPPPPDTVFLSGVDIGRLNEAARTQLRRKMLGFVFQGFNLIDHLTAVENVEMTLRYAGISARPARARALVQLESVGLTVQAQTIASSLSGGERQRVAIARAVVHDPDIIFADEPTGSLDVATGENVLQALISSDNKKRTLVIVTHSPEIAARFPRCLTLDSGTLN